MKITKLFVKLKLEVVLLKGNMIYRYSRMNHACKILVLDDMLLKFINIQP